MIDKRIRACPFCSGRAKLYESTDENYSTGKLTPEYSIECLCCNCGTPTFETLDQALDVWNTRKPIQIGEEVILDVNKFRSIVSVLELIVCSLKEDGKNALAAKLIENELKDVL